MRAGRQTDGRTDGHDYANSCFSQYCERLKIQNNVTETNTLPDILGQSVITAQDVSYVTVRCIELLFVFWAISGRTRFISRADVTAPNPQAVIPLFAVELLLRKYNHGFKKKTINNHSNVATSMFCTDKETQVMSKDLCAVVTILSDFTPLTLLSATLL
jgi:hypothetical protein